MVSPLFRRRVYVDSSALIYTLEAPQIYPRLQTEFFDLFKRGDLTMVTSWITLAEVLIKPLQAGDTLTASGYRAFFSPSIYFEIVPVDQDVADRAAQLRSSLGFKLPDAIHLATGARANCSHFLTGDAQWARAGVRAFDVRSL